MWCPWKQSKLIIDMVHYLHHFITGEFSSGLCMEAAVRFFMLYVLSVPLD